MNALREWFDALPVEVREDFESYGAKETLSFDDQTEAVLQLMAGHVDEIPPAPGCGNG